MRLLPKFLTQRVIIMPRPMKAWARLLLCGDGRRRRIFPPKTLPEIIEVMKLRSRLEDRGYDTKCHIWIGCKPQGYGIIRLNVNEVIRTHRTSWEFFNGKVPDGLEVCHHCDQKDCWEISHLFVGTHHQNMTHASEHKRFNPTTGEDHYSHKLTTEQVLEIRRILQFRKVDRELAMEYGVSYNALRKIRDRISWKHI